MYACSPITTVCAQAALVYAVACIVYYVATRSFGTPFADSLTDAQREIKRASAKRRGCAFAAGVATGVLLVALGRPFHRLDEATKRGSK